MSENRNSGGYNQGGGQGYGDTGTSGTGSSGGYGTGTGSSGGYGSGGGSQSLTPTGGQGTGTGTGTAPAEDRGYGAKIAGAASTAKDYVTDKVSALGDKLSELKNTDIKEVANQAKDYAREKPGQALLISAAAGLVLGLLIRGSRK